MNIKLKHKLKNVSARPGVAVLLVVLLIGIGALQYATGNFNQPADNVTDANMSDNKTDLNVSKYYNNQTKVCEDPSINGSNASELKACVSNQTNVD